MKTMRDYVLENATEYLDDQYKEVQVIVEGDAGSMDQENYNLCKKILPGMVHYDKEARHFIPYLFGIPDNTGPWDDTSDYFMDYIMFGKVTSDIIGLNRKGFTIDYMYVPSGDVHNTILICVKFIERFSIKVNKVGYPMVAFPIAFEVSQRL